MGGRHWRGDFYLFLAAVIWGLAFVAQRVGMQHVGPFTFNAVRFALGALAVLPLAPLWERSRLAAKTAETAEPPEVRLPRSTFWLGGVLVGLALFGGSSFQQVGIVHTTAGKAGFITGLYVVIVPVLGQLLGRRSAGATWAGAVIAVAGLYLLSVRGALHIQRGDLLVLIGAFFWAGHVQLIAWLSPGSNPFGLASLQFAICSLLSLAIALLVETFVWERILAAAVPILYAGLLSAGVAYTLQVVAQRRAHPSHAAIILSLEAVFAVLGGWLILGETLTPRGLVGCTLMLAGMILSQLGGIARGRRVTTAVPQP
jgi:drug/metabolite transporter (DMT)-like permease